MRTTEECQAVIDTWKEAHILERMTEVIFVLKEIEQGNPVSLDHLPENLRHTITNECLKQFGRYPDSGIA